MRAKLGDRLPLFSEADKELLVGSRDFFAQNFYNAFYVSDATTYEIEDPLMPFWSRDLGIVSSGWNPHTGEQIGLQGESTWLFETPGAIRNLLVWIHERYLRHGKELSWRDGGGGSGGDPFLAADALNDDEGRTAAEPLPLYITENGCSAPGESEMPLPAVLNDRYRVAFYFEYLTEVAAAVRKVQEVSNARGKAQRSSFVKGYFAWSLLDNFEWADGYHMRFGLHYVDFSKIDRPRHAKASATWYRRLLLALPTATSATDTITKGAASEEEAAAAEPAMAASFGFTSFLLGASVLIVVVTGSGTLAQAMKRLALSKRQLHDNATRLQERENKVRPRGVPRLRDEETKLAEGESGERSRWIGTVDASAVELTSSFSLPSYHLGAYEDGTYSGDAAKGEKKGSTRMRDAPGISIYLPFGSGPRHKYEQLG
jgi:hypothetical protein